MNKQNLLFWGLLSALGFSQLDAREWRIPSPLSYGYAYNHYPFLPPIDENECNKCWWFDMINPWMAGEFRHANAAYINDSTKKESLAARCFGLPSFNLTNLIAPGASTAAFPLAGFINITPNFDYTENVAWFGLNLEKRFGCEEQWHVGLRLRIPFRDIKTQLDSCCDLESNLNPFVRTESEVICTDDGTPGLILNAFAYRLDFLSALPLATNSSLPFVNYANPAAPIPGDITIGTVDATNQGSTLRPPPVNVIKVPVGSIPSSPFSLRQGILPAGPTPVCTTGNDNTSVTGTTPPALVQDLNFLSTNGTTGFAADNRAVFQSGVNYQTGGLATSPATQATLWVVPTVGGNDGAADILAPARTIQAQFNSLIAGINTSAVNLLSTVSGISFQTQRTSGPGDFLLETYVHRDFCGCWGDWFAEGIIGASFPTAKRTTEPNLLLLANRGNNKHFEVKIGGFLGWKPFDWMAIKIDGFYNWALNRKEKVATPVSGATVKNIGRIIDAKVSWQYFVGDVDITFMVPCICPELGVDVGYQPYYKRHDKISLAQTTGVDVLGNTGVALDASVLQANTKQIAHTIKGELFYQACSWQLFWRL